jgi:hypothetical protein
MQVSRSLGTLSAAPVLSLFGSSRVLAHYTQNAATAGTSDTSVEPGQRVTLGGEGWQPKSTLRLGVPSANPLKDGDGSATGRIVRSLLGEPHASCGSIA